MILGCYSAVESGALTKDNIDGPDGTSNTKASLETTKYVCQFLTKNFKFYLFNGLESISRYHFLEFLPFDVKHSHDCYIIQEGPLIV